MHRFFFRQPNRVAGKIWKSFNFFYSINSKLRLLVATNPLIGIESNFFIDRFFSGNSTILSTSQKILKKCPFYNKFKIFSDSFTYTGWNRGKFGGQSFF